MVWRRRHTRRTVLGVVVREKDFSGCVREGWCVSEGLLWLCQRTHSLLWLSATRPCSTLPEKAFSPCRTHFLLSFSDIANNSALTEEIRLTIVGSPDLPDFPVDLFSDGDFVYSSKNLFEILGTPVKTCLICTGTAEKTCWKFWQTNFFQVRSLPSVGWCEQRASVAVWNVCDVLFEIRTVCVSKQRNDTHILFHTHSISVSLSLSPCL